MIPAWVTNKRGVFLNDLKRYVKGGWLVPGSDRTPLIITAAPSATVPNSAPSVVVEAPPDSVSEIFAMVGENDAGVDPDVAARMSVQITDVAFRRRLTSRHILCSHVFGGAGQNGSNGIPGYFPSFLRESLILEPQQTMLFDFNNNSTAGSTAFRFMMEQRKFQSTSLSRDQVTQYIGKMRARKSILQPYWLTSNEAINIPVGGVKNCFFNNTRSAYFIWFDTVATFIVNGGGAGGDTVEGFTVELFDAKTQRPLQNQPIARSCFAGSAGLPFHNPTALMMEPDTQIQMRITNLVTGGGTSIDVFITLVGVLNYQLENPFEASSVGVATPSAAQNGA
jgi:hypothetical protein